MLAFSTVVYMFMVPWGAVQFLFGRGLDWFILAVSGAVFWAHSALRMEGKR